MTRRASPYLGMLAARLAPPPAGSLRPPRVTGRSGDASLQEIVEQTVTLPTRRGQGAVSPTPTGSPSAPGVLAAGSSQPISLSPAKRTDGVYPAQGQVGQDIRESRDHAPSLAEHAGWPGPSDGEVSQILPRSTSLTPGPGAPSREIEPEVGDAPGRQQEGASRMRPVPMGSDPDAAVRHAGQQPAQREASRMPASLDGPSGLPASEGWGDADDENRILSSTAHRRQDRFTRGERRPSPPTREAHVLEPPRRAPAEPPPPVSAPREPVLHIGSIEVRILPPASQPPRAAEPAPAPAPAAPLSRALPTGFGLRQG